MENFIDIVIKRLVRMKDYFCKNGYKITEIIKACGISNLIYLK